MLVMAAGRLNDRRGGCWRGVDGGEGGVGNVETSWAREEGRGKVTPSFAWFITGGVEGIGCVCSFVYVYVYAPK